ncbi:hypothetical protein HHI36_016908 [Cryptolaemus montrouzieri]|uniref:Uncharacterized protein n=1 Tax=Cryptolaemus montrouzieri TaxID=559131 RepID=A0ABD2NL50_9CUCU
MQIQQMFSETRGILNYRFLSCFYGQLCTFTFLKLIGLCLEHNPTLTIFCLNQLFLNEKEDVAIHEVENFSRTDITNKIGMLRISFYDTVYGLDESSYEDQPLAIYKNKDSSNRTAVFSTSYETLLLENIHLKNIGDGVHVSLK